MADSSQLAGTSFPATGFGSMSDSQLRQTINQLSTAAARTDQFQNFASPAPQAAHSKNYLKNVHQWSTSVTPPPKTPTPTTRSTRSRTNKGSSLATTSAPQPTYTPPVYQQAPPAPPPPPALPTNPPRPALPTSTQALLSTYASRLRTGTTLLMQPILPAAGASGSTTRQTTRRGGAVNYADPGSGDDIPDAGALDSDDSDFVASGGTRTAIRQSRSRMGAGMSVFHASGGGGGGAVSTPQVQHHQPRIEKTELDQSYLGMVPPSRYIKAKGAIPTIHEYPSQDAVDTQANKATALLPIRVEFETDTHRIRDCFVWNLHEELIKPEAFARIFCADLDLPLVPWAETVANQIRAQIEEHEGVASMDLGVDDSMYADEDIPECRVVLSIDVQIATYHLIDHIEWDLLSPLSPERFAQTLCAELGLAGEAIPLVAHAVHEELMKHKKDAIEWGCIGVDAGGGGGGGGHEEAGARDKSGAGLLKDKTGLGLGWGRAPKDGRGPKVLRSVWRDWAEAEEFGTKFEVLSQEEVERREIERERASRRLRRETSKFQSSTRTRRR